MSRKSDLIAIFESVKTTASRGFASSREIINGNAYTPEGKKQELNRLTEQYTGQIQTQRQQAMDAIDAGLQGLESKWKAEVLKNIQNAGYQAGLTNFLHILQTGAIKDKTDIRNAVTVYEGDHNAIAAIRQLLITSTIPAYQEIALELPEDTRGKNRELLQRLKHNVDTQISDQGVFQLIHGSGRTYEETVLFLTLEGFISFVQERLGDDLELISVRA